MNKKFFTLGVALLCLVAVGMALLLSSCGMDGSALITKETAGIQGANGADGVDGINGIDGINGTNGVDGINGIDGINGTNGVDGINGIDGINGTNGYGCLTFNIPGGAVVQCADGSSSVISDGKPGSSIEVLNPCGDSTRHDEVFLKFIDSNDTITVIAFFTDNGSALFGRLAVLKCDNETGYSTTDGQGCLFKLDTDCNFVYAEVK